MNRHIETFEASWNGIQLAITWEPKWLHTGEELGWDDLNRSNIPIASPINKKTGLYLPL